MFLNLPHSKLSLSLPTVVSWETDNAIHQPHTWKRLHPLFLWHFWFLTVCEKRVYNEFKWENDSFFQPLCLCCVKNSHSYLWSSDFRHQKQELTLIFNGSKVVAVTSFHKCPLDCCRKQSPKTTSQVMWKQAYIQASYIVSAFFSPPANILEDLSSSKNTGNGATNLTTPLRNENWMILTRLSDEDREWV